LKITIFQEQQTPVKEFAPSKHYLRWFYYELTFRLAKIKRIIILKITKVAQFWGATFSHC
jgi:hypothetical protein